MKGGGGLEVKGASSSLPIGILAVYWPTYSGKIDTVIL